MWSDRASCTMEHSGRQWVRVYCTITPRNSSSYRPQKILTHTHHDAWTRMFVKGTVDNSPELETTETSIDRRKNKRRRWRAEGHHTEVAVKELRVCPTQRRTEGVRHRRWHAVWLHSHSLKIDKSASCCLEMCTQVAALSRRARGPPPQESGVVACRGKGVGRGLREAYTAAGNVLLCNLSDSCTGVRVMIIY